MKNTDNLGLEKFKSFPDSTQKTGAGPAKKSASETRYQKNIQNKIDHFIERSSFHFYTNVNQEDLSNSNQTKTNSNQKGAHYAKQ